MGYESKIYVVQPYADDFGDVIAMFDLCKMSYDPYNGTTFPGLFTIEKEDSYKIYQPDGNTPVKEDCYGDTVKRAENNQKVIEWLKAFCKGEGGDKSAWYRAVVFRDFLISLEKTGWEYELYHYGY